MSDEVEVKVNDVKVNEVKNGPEERSTSLAEMLRRALLAAVGAVAVSRDEMEQLVNRLVERGQIAEREGRQLIREVLERRKRQVEQDDPKSDGEVESRVEQVLNRLNIPTKRDIEQLSERISELSARIEELKRSRDGQ